MSPDAYLELAQTEERHWWYVGRRAILADEIARLNLPAGASILEIGSGTGGNLAMLARFGDVVGLERDEGARRLCAEKTGGRFLVRPGDCPDDMPFEDGAFDLVCLFDCLEHIDASVETLVRVRGLLKPSGRALVAVPAYPWLWSAHDEFLHHRRRYNRRGLVDEATRAGLRVERATYFNAALFPLGAGARLFNRLTGAVRSPGVAIPPAPVNRLFAATMAAERHVLRHASLPFGLSLLAVLSADPDRGASKPAPA